VSIDSIRAIKQAALLPKPKKTYTIPKKSKKKLALEGLEKEERKGEDTELQKWYANIMQHEMPICWETREKIDIRDKKGWHGSIAHVLPKEHFDSVKTHQMNYMILKMWGGTHGQYDSGWENASKMKVWKYACGIFNILYPLLTAEEKRKLPDVILQEIKPELYNK
jgi:hypothetical protein